MAAILASTITALEGSVMRPVREALVDCARRTGEKDARRRNVSATRCISLTSRKPYAEANARTAIGQYLDRVMGLYHQIGVMLGVPWERGRPVRNRGRRPLERLRPLQGGRDARAPRFNRRREHLSGLLGKSGPWSLR